MARPGWLALGGSPDGVPDIAFVKVDLSGGWEVEVLGPSVAVMDDEVQICSTRFILAAVIYGLSRDVPQEDRSLEDVLEHCHIVDHGAFLMDPLLS